MLEFNLTKSKGVNDVTQTNDDLTVLIGERGRIESWDASNTSQVYYYMSLTTSSSHTQAAADYSSPCIYSAKHQFGLRRHANAKQYINQLDVSVSLRKIAML